MNLQPKEAIVLFIRRGETTPARYIVGIRRAEANFLPSSNDLEFDCAQESVSALGEFDDLVQAINAASEKLKGLAGKAASV